MKFAVPQSLSGSESEQFRRDAGRRFLKCDIPVNVVVKSVIRLLRKISSCGNFVVCDVVFRMAILRCVIL